MSKAKARTTTETSVAALVRLDEALCEKIEAAYPIGADVAGSAIPISAKCTSSNRCGTPIPRPGVWVLDAAQAAIDRSAVGTLR
jgi:hypothetical protein